MTPDTTTSLTALQQALGAIYRQGYADGVAAVQVRCDSLAQVPVFVPESNLFAAGMFVGAVVGCTVMGLFFAVA